MLHLHFLRIMSFQWFSQDRRGWTGYPLEIDSEDPTLGRDFNIYALPQGQECDLAAISEGHVKWPLWSLGV